MPQFDNPTKIAAFDLIAERFYVHNFGQLSKADLEVLMFKIYLDALRADQKDQSDFAVAKELGITETKVRNLKVKKDLQYPSETNEWMILFIESVRYATYDEKANLVKLSIVDPNVKRNLDHKIDQLHVYSEAQLNGKLLQMRPDHFVRLVEEISTTLSDRHYNRQELIEQINRSSVANQFKSTDLLKRINSGEALSDIAYDTLIAAGKTGIKLILSAIPFGECLKPAVDFFLDKL